MKHLDRRSTESGADSGFRWFFPPVRVDELDVQHLVQVIWQLPQSRLSEPLPMEGGCAVGFQTAVNIPLTMPLTFGYQEDNQGVRAARLELLAAALHVIGTPDLDGSCSVHLDDVQVGAAGHALLYPGGRY